MTNFVFGSFEMRWLMLLLPKSFHIRLLTLIGVRLQQLVAGRCGGRRCSMLLGIFLVCSRPQLLTTLCQPRAEYAHSALQHCSPVVSRRPRSAFIDDLALELESAGETGHVKEEVVSAILHNVLLVLGFHSSRAEMIDALGEVFYRELF